MKRRWNGNKSGRKRAASMVEFAIMFPILFLILMGVVEFGRVLSVSHAVSTAAREGARVAALPGSDNAAVTAAVANLLAGAGLAPDAVEFDPPDVSAAAPSQPVSVRVAINYESYGWLQGVFPEFNGTQMERTVVMRKEGFN